MSPSLTDGRFVLLHDNPAKFIGGREVGVRDEIHRDHGALGLPQVER